MMLASTATHEVSKTHPTVPLVFAYSAKSDTMSTVRVDAILAPICVTHALLSLAVALTAQTLNTHYIETLLKVDLYAQTSFAVPLVSHAVLKRG